MGSSPLAQGPYVWSAVIARSGLKVAGTDVITAAECWRAVRARLTELSRLEGVDTSGEWVRYSSLATAHGVEA